MYIRYNDKCGQCPASKCVSESSILGVSPNNGNNNGNNGGNDDDNSNTALIGGLVGGLVAGGLIIGAIVFGLLKYRKNKRITLPITFHSSVQKYANNKKDSISSQQMKESTRGSAQSFTSGVIPIAYIPPSHHIQEEEQQQQHHSISLSPSQQHHQPWISQEIENRSNISTPPLSAQLSTPTKTLVSSSYNNSKTTLENPFQDPRHTVYSLNSEDDDDDDDMSSKHDSMVGKVQLASHQAVQVTRAKPQILRVNTVRDLSRGDSVRTIFTKSENDQLSRSNTLESSSHVTTKLDHSNMNHHHRNDNPFQDDRYTVNEENDEDEDDMKSTNTRPVTNHSMASTIGDGEITIFWSGSNPSHNN
ncbi:unnamed protein product [Cunninghamella blakesleeana]